jgi:hypothetical protein
MDDDIRSEDNGHQNEEQFGHYESHLDAIRGQNVAPILKETKKNSLEILIIIQQNGANNFNSIYHDGKEVHRKYRRFGDRDRATF